MKQRGILLILIGIIIALALTIGLTNVRAAYDLYYPYNPSSIILIDSVAPTDLANQLEVNPILKTALETDISSENATINFSSESGSKWVDYGDYYGIQLTPDQRVSCGDSTWVTFTNSNYSMKLTIKNLANPRPTASTFGVYYQGPKRGMVGMVDGVSEIGAGFYVEIQVDVFEKGTTSRPTHKMMFKVSDFDLGEQLTCKTEQLSYTNMWTKDTSGLQHKDGGIIHNNYFEYDDYRWMFADHYFVSDESYNFYHHSDLFNSQSVSYIFGYMRTDDNMQYFEIDSLQHTVSYSYMRGQLDWISGESEEKIYDGRSPSVRVNLQPFNGYYFAGWVCDRDVDLNNGQHVTAGTPMSSATARKIIVNRDIMLYATTTQDPDREVQGDIAKGFAPDEYHYRVVDDVQTDFVDENDVVLEYEIGIDPEDASLLDVSVHYGYEISQSEYNAGLLTSDAPSFMFISATNTSQYGMQINDGKSVYIKQFNMAELDSYIKIATSTSGFIAKDKIKHYGKNKFEILNTDWLNENVKNDANGTFCMYVIFDIKYMDEESNVIKTDTKIWTVGFKPRRLMTIG